jgi:hypothetical protein
VRRRSACRSPSCRRARRHANADPQRSSDGIRAADATYEAVSPPELRRAATCLLRVEPDDAPISLHAVGTVEHVVLISGSALVGPADAPIELAPGDSSCGDAARLRRARHEPRAVLVSEVR